LERNRANLRVRIVRSSDGQPLDELSWQLSDLQGATSRRQTLSEGVLEIAELQPGQKTLLLEAPSLESKLVRVDLEPGAELDLGTLALGPAHGIRGRVLDAAGRAIAAKVKVIERERFQAGAHELALGAASFRALDGELAIEGLAAGRYYAQVEGPQNSYACFELELGAADPTPFEWRLPRAEPIAVRVDAPMQARWNLLVLDGHGRPLAELSGKGKTERTLGLEAGRAELSLRIEGREPQRFPLQVWQGENAPVRLP
jgi:hypothetical protein